METWQAYEQKLRAKLDEWRAEIDKLKAKAAQADANQRLKYQEEIRNLENRQAEMKEKLEQLRTAGEGASQDLKTGIERAWSDLSDAISKMSARFR